MNKQTLCTGIGIGLFVGLIIAVPMQSSANDAIDFWLKNHKSTGAEYSSTPPLNILPEPSRFVRGRLKCARNVNAHLNHMGYRGTGSDIARSFFNYGKAVSGPQIGAIQVERRGRNPNAGHVQIVHSQRSDGVWTCRNPSSHLGKWTYQPCANPRVIAYRIPTGADLLPQRMYAGNVAKPRHAPFPVTASAYAPPVGYLGAAIMPASFIPSSYGAMK
jgi:hypothetical protein